MESRIHSDDVNVLVLSSIGTSEQDHACGELLAVKTDSPDALIGVALLRTPDELLDIWRAHVDSDFPDSGGIVAVNDGARSTAVDTQSTIEHGVPIPIRCVSNPGDLSKLGLEITRLLPEQPDSSSQIVGCFDSLTVLFQYSENKRVFRFLHVLTEEIASHNVLMHYHLDPGAHDEETITTLKPLFDRVITYSEG